MEMFGKSEVTSKGAFDALNKVEESVSKTVYATDGQEDWQKWKVHDPTFIYSCI